MKSRDVSSSFFQENVSFLYIFALTVYAYTIYSVSKNEGKIKPLNEKEHYIWLVKILMDVCLTTVLFMFFVIILKFYTQIIFIFKLLKLYLFICLYRD